MSGNVAGETATSGTNRRRSLPACALIAVAIAIAYANAHQGPFVLDDVAAIVENPTIRDFAQAYNPPSDRGLPVTGRPIVNLSLAINYRFGGLDPRGYHLVNVALHALAALTLFGLVRRTLEMQASQAVARRARLVALLAALTWSVHPLATAAVTYIVQRAEILASLFYLLTLYAFLRGKEC